MNWMKKVSVTMLVFALVLSFGFSSIVSATVPEVKLYDASYYVSGSHSARSFSGQIEVENLGYSKVVTVHYTPDGGTTWKTLNASYSHASGVNHEIWDFSTYAHDYSLETPRLGNVVSFYIEYEVNGQTYWDTNGGSNYTVSTITSHFALGVPAVISWYRGLYSTGFSGDIVLKNLAYAKSVNIIYTTDNWTTTQTLSASYDSSIGNNLELWKFNTSVSPSVTQISFYISYTVGGITYYDNNFNSNYTVIK